MTTESHRPIFILGCPRSGTTMMQFMVHSHPRICIAPETRFLLSEYRARLRYGDLNDPANRKKLAKSITRSKKTMFPKLHLDRDETIEQIVAGPPTIGSAMATVLRSYARSHDKPRWGDKRPRYLQHVDWVLRMFPDAQFVHVIRDGRDNVGSLKSMGWWGADSYVAALTWKDAIERGRWLGRKVGAERYYEIQYEKLVADPESELQPLCDFLGEKYDPVMAEPQETAKQFVADSNPTHSRTHEKPNAERVRAWEKRLEPWEVSMVEYIAGSQLKDYGYELSGGPRPSRDVLIRLARTVARRRYWQRKLALKEMVKRRREPNPVESLLTGSAFDTGDETSQSDLKSR